MKETIVGVKAIKGSKLFLELRNEIERNTRNCRNP